MLTEIQWIKRLGGVGRVGDICQMRRRRVGWRVDGRIARWIFHHDFRHGRWCLVGSVGRCYHFCARFAARLKVESTQCWAGRCIYWIVIGAAWSIWTWWAWHVHGSHLCDGAYDFRRDWLWCGHCNSSWCRKRRKFNIRTFSYAARETFMRAIKVDAACLLSFLSSREASSWFIYYAQRARPKKQ